MTSPHSFSFSKPAMPGDAVSVLILVEDSAQMAAKWPDVRDSYLPVLLENLRADDPSVQVRSMPFLFSDFSLSACSLRWKHDGSRHPHHVQSPHTPSWTQRNAVTSRPSPSAKVTAPKSRRWSSTRLSPFVSSSLSSLQDANNCNSDPRVCIQRHQLHATLCPRCSHRSAVF